MFCNNCGANRVPNLTACHICGHVEQGGQISVTPGQSLTVTPPSIDSGGFVWGFFGFIFSALLFPLILFFQWKDQMPLRARAMLIGYLIGFIVCIIILVIVGMIIIVNYDAIYEWLNESAGVVIISLRSLRR